MTISENSSIVIKYSDDLTARSLLETLEKTGQGFLAFVDDKGHLMGVVSDGDVRRAFINGISDTAKIINWHPLTWSSERPKAPAIAFLRRIKRRHLPVIDSQGILLDIISLNDHDYRSFPNLVLIMAGGKGTRLKPLTDKVPKPMLEIGGKPILEIILNRFYNQGFSNFVISVGYKANVIKDYFGNGEDFGLSLSYLEESDSLGTAGALSLIQEKLSEPFVVVNGDLLASVNLKKVLDHHTNNKAYLTICVKKMSYRIPFGTIKINQDGTVSSFIEKPEHNHLVNSGIYVFDPEVLTLFPKTTKINMNDLIQKLLDTGKKVCSFCMDGFWQDIGQLEDYLRIKSNFSDLLAEDTE